jgi:hypothetical protein
MTNFFSTFCEEKQTLALNLRTSANSYCGLVLRSVFAAAIMFLERRRSRKINLQRDGKHAKPYQVRQVRTMIINNNLGGDNERD